MIESNNPEINVDDLMQQIQEEVARRHQPFVAEEAKLTSTGGVDAMITTQIEALLNDAQTFSQIPTKFPDKFNRFPFNLSKGLQKFILKLYGFLFKKQQVVNFSLIQSLRDSLALNRRLTDQVNILQEQLTQMNHRLSQMNERLSQMNERLSATQNANTNHLTATINAINENLVTAINATDQRIMATINATNQRVTALDERYFRNDNYLKNDLNQQKRLIALFLEEAQKRLPESFNREQRQTLGEEGTHLLDAFYVAFEEQFRGSSADIINRLKIYLPLIEEAKVGTPEFPILDVGCGRGEWLRLLHDSGYTARGLDLNRVMLDECRDRNLEVIEGDVITYLQSLPDASLGAVTGFHIIEHLPFPALLKLLEETIRVIKPGGLAIFETPNPQNILVGSNNFYLDPSHLKPLPSPLMKFLLEHRGFYRVEIKKLNPYEESLRISNSELSDFFNNYVYGPQDYAVVGHKI